MQNTPIAITERFAAIGGAAIMALLIFGIATLLHNAISKNDRRKRIQGRPIRWWVTALYAIGAVLGAMLADNKQYYMHEIVGGLGGFGILAGLLVGNVHGGIHLFLTPNSSDSSDKNSSVMTSETSMPLLHDSENPYSPPTE